MPLALIGGKPMIWYVYASACKARCLDHCCVVTDDARVAKAVTAFGGEVIVVTNAKWETGAGGGTASCLGEAVARLRKKQGQEFDVVVSVHCGEPFIQPHHIEIVADLVAGDDAVMGALARHEQARTSRSLFVDAHTKTFYYCHAEENCTRGGNLNFFIWEEQRRGPLREEGDDAHGVRCALDAEGYALHFSRGALPREESETKAANEYKVACGIYGYRADLFLPSMRKMRMRQRGGVKASAAAAADQGLEQNRLIAAGHRVKAELTDELHLCAVRTAEQVESINLALKEGKLFMPQV